MREALKAVHRLVIKAGTSILTSRGGHFSKRHLQRLGEEILKQIKHPREVVLVSSGAIALGMEVYKFTKRPSEMALLQACAAIGQGKLMHAYEQFFSKRGIHTAQILLTRDGLEIRSRFLRARRTLRALLDMKNAQGQLKTLAVVNENDTVATDEIAFGDNDTLAVQVAHLIHADLVILLSDVDGFFLDDGSRLRQVSSEKEIDEVLMRHLRDRGEGRTVGGMKAKLIAARFAMRLGIPLMILDGHAPSIVSRAVNGEDIGTLFVAERHEKSARKKWIAFSAARQGTVVVDEGAFRALSKENRSLLPSGMMKVRGQFDKGQVVELETADGHVFGRGIVRYSSRELAQLVGKKTGEIESILGYKTHDEVIHRNDLVIWS